MVKRARKKELFTRIPGFKLLESGPINSMYRRKGAIPEDAISLDDNDDGEQATPAAAKKPTSVNLSTHKTPRRNEDVAGEQEEEDVFELGRPKQQLIPSKNSVKVVTPANESETSIDDPSAADTSSQWQRLGFAALSSAKDDPRYARLHNDKGADKSNTGQGQGQKSNAPKSKERPRKQAVKKADLQPPTYDILESNRKRPLAEMPVGQLFTPGQVISSSEWERTKSKRQRVEREQDRALRNITNAKETRDAGIAYSEENKDQSRDGVLISSSKAPIDQGRSFVPIDNDKVQASPSTDYAARTAGDVSANNEIDDLPEISDRGDRPTTGGKGISAATLAAWEAESVKTRETVDRGFQPVYQYFVSRREFKPTDEGEADATTSRLGPFFTLEEANAVAGREIHHPVENDELDGIPGKAWAFLFEQDDIGMQTHMAEVVGIRIEAAVKRELAQPESRSTFPAKAFKICPTVYLIQELSWYPPATSPLTPPFSQENGIETSSQPSQPACETITHGCATTLERANKRASEQWLECLTGKMSDFGAEGMRKDELEREIRKDLKELREEGRCFEREVEFQGAGCVKFWVVAVAVEGPRN